MGWTSVSLLTCAHYPWHSNPIRPSIPDRRSLKTRPVCAKVALNYKPEEEEEEERFDCDAEVDGATSSLLMGHDTNMLDHPRKRCTKPTMYRWREKRDRLHSWRPPVVAVHWRSYKLVEGQSYQALLDENRARLRMRAVDCPSVAVKLKSFSC